MSALYKVVLIGQSDVGKSSAFVRFKSGFFEEDLTSTIGLDAEIREVSFLEDEKDPSSEKKVELQLWDTAGLERVGRMTNNYYKNSHAIILMYGIDDLTSLGHLRSWFEDAKLYAPIEPEQGHKTLYFIVGNKTDLSSGNTEVSEERAEKFIREVFPSSALPESHIFRISVKSGNGFKGMFSQIAKTLTENMTPTRQHRGIHIEHDPEDRKQCGC